MGQTLTTFSDLKKFAADIPGAKALRKIDVLYLPVFTKD
jgi:hypothetical protein